MPHHSPSIEQPELLRLYFLGTFRVERKGQTIRLSTRKHESLLAYLALFPEPHLREKLAALFWGDVTDEQARLSLRVALSTLRKELGNVLFRADRDTVQLNPDCHVWVDAREFEESVKNNSESANELYCGDLLPDLYDDWVALEREQLRSVYLDALLRLVQHARSESKYTRAIEFARRVLATDRANEKAHQHLIFCYLALGNRTAALKQYEDCQRALRDEMDVEPSSETTALYVRAQTKATNAKSPEALFTNLPTPLTSFVGRVNEIGQIKQTLDTTRLLTFVGAGGCGKTRLAIQVATELAAAEKFRDGVWWVELAALVDPALVTQTVAMVFNVSESSAMPLIAVLTNYLRAKKLLVVLDNCEHLLGACAQLVGTILSACPRLCVMVTSREPLNISGEIAWRVPSLALPDTEHLPPLAQLRQYDAIQLFVERAVAVAKNWRLAENGVPTVQVCSRLDGIPLAIELAVAQLKNFPVQQIATRLDDRFNLLTESHPAALPRHQTLRATMDWSYDLLSDAERALLRRLSVFAGGFSLQAIQDVCADVEKKHPLALQDILTLLIDKSLVVVERRDSEMRYRLLETARQYAHEKLVEAGEAERTQTLHRDYFVEWIEQVSPYLQRANAIEWRDRIGWDYDNLRAAWEYAIEYDPHIGLRIAWALRQFWSWRGIILEGRGWLDRLIAKSESWGQTAQHAQVYNLAAYLANLVFDIPGGIRLAQEGLTIARAAGDQAEIAFAFTRLGFANTFNTKGDVLFARNCFAASLDIFSNLGNEDMVAWCTAFLGFTTARCGDASRGIALMQEGIAQFRALGDRTGLTDALQILGIFLPLAGDSARGEPYCVESVEICRELQNKHNLANALCILGRCLLRGGNYRRGFPYSVEAMQLYLKDGSETIAVMTIEEIAICIGMLGEPEPAARLYGAVKYQYETQRASPLLQVGIYDKQWAHIRAQLGDTRFENALTEGRAMSLEQAVDNTLENVKSIK